MTAIFIPITAKQLADEAVQTVDARELHAFLGVETRFNDWITRRIADYSFLSNRDFWEFSAQKRFGIFSKEMTDYVLSLDMAKELAMVERNEKGRQARRYFIDAEKRLRAQAAAPAWAKDTAFLPELLDDCGLTAAAAQRLVKQLSAAAVAKRPLRARVVLAAQSGLTWQELRESGKSKRKPLLNAVEDCLKLGLITAAPRGTPLPQSQGALALTEGRK